MTVFFTGCGVLDYDSRLTSRSVLYLGGALDPAAASENDIAEAKSYWDGEGLAGPVSIVINIKQQTASLYKGDKLAGVSAISSGRSGYDTPPGNYTILQKCDKNYASNLYGDFKDANGNLVKRDVSSKDPVPPGARFVGSPMPYFMRLTTGGVGMHQGFIPGIPDSHGCIRMPHRMAQIFSANVELGTPVQIVSH